MRTRRFTSSGNPVGGIHRSVLLHEAVDALTPAENSVIVDATLGGAGHAKEIARRLGKTGTLVGFDADTDAIERARRALAGAEAKLYFVHANFRDLEARTRALGLEFVDGILFDLGWSGFQLSSGRGFSFLADEELSMSYDQNAPLQASDIVNKWEEGSLADIIYGWGEERYARRIAKAIVAARESKGIRTARELAEIVSRAVPPAYRRGRLHPATKTFQALRIAVNDELGSLERALGGAKRLLRQGGKIAVISFHSLEDRLVKRLFLEWEKEGHGRRLTKKPLVPAAEEIRENPRARSAKLRIFERV